MLESFETINAQLIEARKTIQERDRILSLMAGIDRQLAERRRELSLSVTQLKYEKQDMQALEGLSFESLYYTLLGRKEEQLEKETAEYLDLKMATEKCRLTIASLEAQMQHFEAELILYADCDDGYERVKQKQAEFLVQLGVKDSTRLMAIQNTLAQKKALAVEIEEAVRAGKAALSSLEKLSHKRLSPKTGLDSNGKTLAKHTQFLLDLFQTELTDISHQFHPAPQLAIPDVTFSLLPTLGIRNLYGERILDPSHRSTLPQKWLYHLQQIMNRIQSKMDRLNGLYEQTTLEIAALEKEHTILIKQIWHVSNLSD